MISHLPSTACTFFAEGQGSTHPRTAAVALYACSALIQAHWMPCRCPAHSEKTHEGADGQGSLCLG